DIGCVEGEQNARGHGRLYSRSAFAEILGRHRRRSWATRGGSVFQPRAGKEVDGVCTAWGWRAAGWRRSCSCMCWAFGRASSAVWGGRRRPLPPESQAAAAPARKPISSAKNRARKLGSEAVQGRGQKLMTRLSRLAIAKTTRITARGTEIM